MNKSEKNFFFAIFLLIVSIILFINSWIYGVFTILATFSHLKDSDDFKKIIEKYINDMKILKDEDRKNSKNIENTILDLEQLTKKELNAKLKELNYNRSGLSIFLKIIAVLGILGYTSYLGYTDYIS